MCITIRYNHQLPRLKMIYFVILLTLITTGNTEFDHNVKPSCPADKIECEFDWNINYLLTMTLYNWTTYMGEPINFMDGALCKRDIFACGSDPSLCIPVTKEELDSVVIADGSHTMIYAINNEFPGPSIIVFEHQTVVVRVKNNLLSEGITIHWHGMHQRNTPWMDGAAMISQCPILPGQSFTYRFEAFPPGTHWYHSHVGTQRSEGLSGALIVLPQVQRPGLSPPENSFIFIVQDWASEKAALKVVKEQDWYMDKYAEGYFATTCYKSTRSYDSSLVGSSPFEAALINGKGQAAKQFQSKIGNDNLPIEVFNVNVNRHYRFRMINTASLYSFRVSIDNHTIVVISTDGYDLKPQEAQSVMIFPGERFDVIVHTHATPGNYWIRAQTLDVYNFELEPNEDSFGVLAALHYNEVPYTRPGSKPQVCKGSEICVIVNCPFTTESISVLEPKSKCVVLSELKSTEKVLKRNPIPKPKNERDFKELFFNFHFNGDDLRLKRPAINQYQYRSPSSPLQLYPDVGKVVINCSTLRSVDPNLCTYMVKLKRNVVTQITMTNYDAIVGSMVHPVHLHGTAFHVMKFGFPRYDNITGFMVEENKDISYQPPLMIPQWRNRSWNGGNVPGLNFENPPLKDTVVVPSKGYVVIRFRADNPGYWFMHCHVETHQLIGMAVVLQIGEPNEMTPPPPGIPQCGNFEFESWETINIESIATNKKFTQGSDNRSEECNHGNTTGKYILIHKTWIITAGSLSLGLLVVVLALVTYMIVHRRKFLK